jgi:hypothetical protein|tara:strand:- start:2039 stop:2293 length:255 start_codon:yes stop_codon:yes gene_type:complete
MVKYEFIDIGESSTGIRINEGEYEGMSWMYGKVAFDEQSEELKLSFDYEVIENPNNIKPSEELEVVMGDILVNIIRDDSKTDDS